MNVLRLPLLSLSLFIAASAIAQTGPRRLDPGYRPAPGNLGANAFTGWLWRVDDAHINPDYIIADISYRHVKDRWGNWSPTGYARVEIPFSALASFEIGYLVQGFNYNQAAVDFLQPKQKSGFEVGDVVAGVKYRILKEKEGSLRPSITLHGSFKTASGGFENGNFTDSSGYSIDILLAKEILFNHGAFKKIRFMVEAGFLAWDDGAHSQNDAPRYGGAVQAETRNSKWSATVGYHGLDGWHGRVDQTGTGYLQLQYKVRENFRLSAAYDYGVRRAASNPSTYSVTATVRFKRKQVSKVPTPFGPM